MSLGKLPVIGWVSGSHSKRRLKSELTPDMISPPLADFRHTMHVGRGGDVFGDTSFLSNHGGTEAAKANNFFARTLRHVRKAPLRNRGSGGKAEASPAPPAISPIIKNAVSLPQLNEGTYGSDSLAGKFAFKHTPNNMSDTHCAYGLESGFCTIPRVLRSEKARESSLPAEAELQRSDSLLSFRLDLGPSLMSELLQVISFPDTVNSTGKKEHEEEQALTSCQVASPLTLHETWLAERGPKGSGTPNTNIEGDMAESPWGHCRQGANSPVRHLVHANGDAQGSEYVEEDPPYAGSRYQSPGWATAPAEEPGVLPKDTTWQGHWNDCSMEAGQFSRAAQVLARHYGGRSIHSSLEKEEEDPRGARTQASWEIPTVGSWRADEAGWSHSEEEEQEEEEEEEEEAALSAVQEGQAMAGEGRSNSFEYADEEDEEDEVKV